MKRLPQAWVWLVLITFLLLSCSNYKNDTALVTIKSATQHNAEVKIYFTRHLDEVTLIELKTDSIGHCTFEVPVKANFFAILKIGSKYAEVYLSPGDDLQIEETNPEYTTPLKFSGRGAQTNNYISWINSNVEKIKSNKGVGLNQLDYNGYLHRYDSIKTIMNSFHKHYTDSVKLSKETIDMLVDKNRIKLSELDQEFKFYNLNDILNQKWQAKKDGREYKGVSHDSTFKNLNNEITFDSTLLTGDFTDYQMLLRFYWHNEIDLSVADKILESGVSYDLVPHMTNDLIRNGDYPESIREYLLALNLKYCLSRDGITPGVDSIFTDFKKAYEKSDYIPALDKEHNEWLAIAPGKPAPDFEGFTLEGKKVSIKDLRGKLIYIDVWATWCGPCVAEIPASKKLHKLFPNEEKIQFLNVSVDGDHSEWENFVKRDKTWEGLHIIIERDKINSFYKTYKLSGVPDFILIDQAGNIVDMKAPRPSDENVKTKINLLLSQGS